MSRVDAKVVVNNFQGGLVTEASAINAPGGSLSEAMNIRILRDGSLMKRPGLQPTDSVDVIGNMVDGFEDFQLFEWPQQGATVFRIKNSLIYRKVVSETGQVITKTTSLTTTVLPNGPVSIAFSKTHIFVAHNDGSDQGSLMFAEMNLDSNGVFESFPISSNFKELAPKIRDFKGVPNLGQDLAAVDPSVRSELGGSSGREGLTRFQQYNLLNGGWPGIDSTVGIGKTSNNAGQNIPHMDCIGMWRDGQPDTEAGNIPFFIPALGDSFHAAKSASASATEAVGAFSRFEVVKNSPSGRYSGKHVIELFKVALSQKAYDINYYGRKFTNVDPSWYTYAQQSAWDNYTSGEVRSKATAIAFAFNRLWVGGFDVESIESNIGFSKSIGDSDLDFEIFYQENDPTDAEINQLLDTDGGVLNLEGTGKIYEFTQLNKNLLVFAENGVWSISGSSGGSFSATDYSVSKISSTPCIGVGLSVNTPAGIFYLNESGVQRISENEFGTPTVVDVSTSLIQSKIASVLKNKYNRKGCQFSYDLLNSKVHFNFKDYYRLDDSGSHISFADLRRSLIFDLTSNTWTERLRGTEESDKAPHYDSSGNVVAYNDDAAWYGLSLFDGISTARQADGDNMVYFSFVDSSTAGRSSFNTCTESGTSFYDHIPTEPFIASAQTNPMILTDPMTDKQISYLEIYASNPKEIDSASCTVNTNYSWSTEPTGQPFEAIRYQHYPVQQYHDESAVLVSKSKVQGKGKAVSLSFYNDDLLKSFKILGYAMTYSSTAGV